MWVTLGLVFCLSFPLLAQEVFLRLPLVDSLTQRPVVGCPVQVVVGGPEGDELISGTPGPGGVLEGPVHVPQVVWVTVSAAGYLPAQVEELRTVRGGHGSRAYLVPEGPVRLVPLAREVVGWRPLSWADFQGVPPPDPGIEAARIHIVLSWRLEVEVRREGDMWRAWIPPHGLDVECFMSPARSWVRLGAELPTLLLHEQGHFDLAEVYRRLLEEAFLQLTALGPDGAAARSSLEGRAAELAQGILARLEAAQLRYDADTKHGTDPKAQSAWLSQIRRWLASPHLAP
ncbi:DUF922 domain-containing protein [Candidatus Bipolaricaulota bacterium]|nr:DUF922 domain-containing protein [Candidatus Bipolaricaulota bacterium]